MVLQSDNKEKQTIVQKENQKNKNLKIEVHAPELHWRGLPHVHDMDIHLGQRPPL